MLFAAEWYLWFDHSTFQSQVIGNNSYWRILALIYTNTCMYYDQTLTN